jgi:RNase P subunit RPR2
MDIEKDITIICKQCQKPFIWTAGEQKYYLSKGLATPKYCLKCREIRKASINKEV